MRVTIIIAIIHQINYSISKIVKEYFFINDIFYELIKICKSLDENHPVDTNVCYD